MVFWVGATCLWTSGAAQKQPPAPIHIYLYGKHQARVLSRTWRILESGQTWGTSGNQNVASYGKLWQAMASYGKLWQAMASYGKLWQAMASYGELWRAMASYGELWRAMASYGELWRAMASYGELWRAMASYGELWRAMASYGELWRAMASYGELWRAMASYGELWRAMASYGELWQAMASYGKLWQAGKSKCCFQKGSLSGCGELGELSWPKSLVHIGPISLKLPKIICICIWALLLKLQPRFTIRHFDDFVRLF